MKVAVIGASQKKDRYSYKAITMLLEKGHEVFPVHPALSAVQGQKVYASPSDIKQEINTVTLYVNSERSSAMEAEILGLKPKRIIFNPGAENKVLFHKANELGITCMEACTLVLLSTNQF